MLIILLVNKPDLWWSEFCHRICSSKPINFGWEISEVCIRNWSEGSLRIRVAFICAILALPMNLFFARFESIVLPMEILK